MMRVGLAASLATAALAAPFGVPADDARWTVTPRYMRALDVFHGVGCLAGSSGLVMRAGLRAELLFNGTQLRLTGIAPPLDAQILMDGEPLPMRPSFEPGAAACVPFAEWPTLDELTLHNLTIVAPPTGRFQFLIANATGIALDPESSQSSESASTPPLGAPTSSSLPDSSQPQSQSGGESQSDITSPDSSPSPSTPSRTPHAGLLIAAVLAPLALFLAAGFALYYYKRRRAAPASDATTERMMKRSRSFKGMHETQFVMVPETVRPEMGTPGVVKV